MPNLNKVFLMGHLTRDPELRYAVSGTAIASFGMAINRNWNSADGQKKEETCFVDVSAFGKRAEVINEHFSKGDPIFTEGRLQFQQWETKDGQKRNALKMVVENFQFIGGSHREKAKPPQQDKRDDIDDEEIPF